MEKLYQNIDEASKVGFNQLSNIYAQHSIKDLLELLEFTKNNKDQLNKVISYLDALLSDSNIYKQLILSEDSFTFIQTLLSHQNKKIRSLLQECIDYHDFEFGQLLSQMVQEKQQTLNLMLQVIFYQLSDPESEVGLRALKVAKKLFKFPDANLIILLKCELFQTYMITGLSNKNEVIQLRFVELLIYITNIDQSISQIYENQFKLVFKLYNTDDLLVKLNMIELISGMGNSKWNAELMVNQSFFKQILNSAFTNNEDFYTQKYEVLLVVRMMSQRVVKFTPLLEKNLIKLLIQWLTTNQTEQIEGALEVLSGFVQYSEGFNSITKNQDFLALFFKYLYSTKEIIKTKAYNTFQSFFKVDNQQAKPPGKIIWLYSQLGNCTNILSQFQNEELVNEATSYLIKQLNTPFSQFELTILDLLNELLEWDDIFSNIIANQSLLIYFSKISQNKEIYDVKNRTKSLIIKYCLEKYKTQEYLDYAKTLQTLNQQKDVNIASETN